MDDLKIALIDETQRKVNELMGICTEDFLKQNLERLLAHKHIPDHSASVVMDHCISVPLSDPLQRMVNRMLGVSDQESAIREASLIQKDKSLISATQEKVNRMMGINDETFLKYNK